VHHAGVELRDHRRRQQRHGQARGLLQRPHPSKGLKFSNVNVACAGTATLTIYTTNGDAVGTSNRHLSFIVNGGAPQDVAFMGALDWSHPVGTNVTLSGFNQGTNNTIYVTASGTTGAPDLDWIEITNTGATCGASMPVPGTCTPTKWIDSANVNAATAPAGHDGNAGTRFTTNRAMLVGDYYELDMTGVVYLQGVMLNNSSAPNDYAASYDVFSSVDGALWTKNATQPGMAGTTNIIFPRTSARYLKVQVNTVRAGAVFSIGELQASGCALQ
jgi:hypothetical protein